MLSQPMKPDEATPSSEARISTSRFEIPLNPEDEYAAIPLELSSSFDLSALREQAEASACRKAQGVLKKHPRLKNCTSPEAAAEMTAEQIWNFLMLKHYRRGRAEYAEVNRGAFLTQIKEVVLKGDPIELLLSFFPMKTLNPLTTWGKDGSEIDFGEVAALLRLHEIAFGISEFHEPGAKFVVAADGGKYNDCFGYTDDDAAGYFSNIQAAITQLGIQKTVDVFPEASLFPKNIDEHTERHACTIRDRINHELGIRKHVETIAQSAAFAIPIPPDLTTHIIALAFSSKNDEYVLDLSAEALDLRQRIKRLAFEAAIKYIARYDATREVAPIEKHCPNALRATVHAKPGQIGIHPLNQRNVLFPHRGQGFTKNPSNLGKARVRFRADLERCRGNVFGVVLDPQNISFFKWRTPFFYW